MSDVKIYRVYEIYMPLRAQIPQLTGIPAEEISELYEPIGYFDAEPFYDLIDERGEVFYLTIYDLRDFALDRNDPELLKILEPIVTKHFQIERQLQGKANILYQVVYID